MKKTEITTKEEPTHVSLIIWTLIGGTQQRAIELGKTYETEIKRLIILACGQSRYDEKKTVEKHRRMEQMLKMLKQN